MKSNSKVIVTALIALSSITAFAGEYNFSPGRSCSVPGGGGGTCCHNTGYVFAYGGVSFSNDFTATLLNRDSLINNSAFQSTPISSTEEFDYDTGFIIGGGVGVRSKFLGGSRFELEGLFTENDIDSIQTPAFTDRFGNSNLPQSFDGSDINGDISTAAVMINFLKEFPIGHAVGYVGAGIGIAQVESDLTLNGDTVSDTDFSIAHQFILGADLPVSDCLNLFIQYKLFNAGDVDLLCPTGIPGITKLAQFEGTYQSSLSAGARFFF